MVTLVAWCSSVWLGVRSVSALCLSALASDSDTTCARCLFLLCSSSNACSSALYKQAKVSSGLLHLKNAG